MKCEFCLALLEEYLDGELAAAETAQVSEHLITCVSCASERDGLRAEQEIYSRYDRALDITPAMWAAIAARTDAGSDPTAGSARPPVRDRLAGLFSEPLLGKMFGRSLVGAMAVLLLAAMFGVAYLKSQQQQPAPPDLVALDSKAASSREPDRGRADKGAAVHTDLRAGIGAIGSGTKSPSKPSPRARRRLSENPAAGNQSDVLFSDVAYSMVEEQETQRHIEQAQNLLRSVRNIEFDDDDTEIDVTYEKALSRQLLNDNVVLRRDAEMSGKFPVKELLSSLEPFLLDIANLSDKTTPDDLRVIKDRVQKTEIVAALHSY